MSGFMHWILNIIVSYSIIFIGGFDKPIKALLIFMLIEYISSILCVVTKKYSCSKIGIKNITKKIMMLILVGFANTIDVYIINTIPILRTATILFYVSCIGLSIIKNAQKLGLDIPVKLKKVIEKLFNDNNDTKSA